MPFPSSSARVIHASPASCRFHPPLSCTTRRFIPTSNPKYTCQATFIPHWRPSLNPDPFLMSRRHTTKSSASIDPSPTATSSSSSSAHNHNSHNQNHSHDHDHGIFHPHVHDHSEGAEQIINAFRSGNVDRGTRITLLGTSDPLPFPRPIASMLFLIRPDASAGLGSNVTLTVTKGLAGLWMNSASLLAEAGHSLSDLLGVSMPMQPCGIRLT